MDDFCTYMVDYCRPGHIQHCGMKKLWYGNVSVIGNEM